MGHWRILFKFVDLFNVSNASSKLMNQKTSTRVKIETENDNLLVGVHNDYTMYLTEDRPFLMAYLSLERIVSPEILLQRF